MTGHTTHTGATEKFAATWENVFGGKKTKKKATKKKKATRKKTKKKKS